MRSSSFGRSLGASSASEVESPMWTTALHFDLVESSAWALVSGGGFEVPAARASSTRTSFPSAAVELSPAIPAAARTRIRPALTIATRIGGAKVSHFQPTARRRAKKRPIAPWGIGSPKKPQETGAGGEERGP